jgi:hypothetical protein
MRQSPPLALEGGLADHEVPLALPEVEALGVQLERFPTPGQRDALDHPLVFGNDPVAAHTAHTSSAPGPPHI